ncbi:MAG TPA: CAP domain-containing protein [Ruminiclostridium sp.]|nr:CAP domain-containing protein [Ruminiclostridium sp.]
MNKKSSLVISSIAACAIFASAFAFNGLAIGNTKAGSIATQNTNISQSTEPAKKIESILTQAPPAVSLRNVSDSNKADVNKSAVNNFTANVSKSTNCPKKINVDTTADTNTVQNSSNQPTAALTSFDSADIARNFSTVVYKTNCPKSTANNSNYSTIQDRLNALLSKLGLSAKSAASKPAGSTAKPASSTAKPAAATTATGSFAAFQNKVVQLVNAERAKNGLKPLKMNAQLNKTATLKSQDMAKLGYFDHNSPTYGSPFDMMKKYGISYSTAGENIAMGQTTPEQVMNGWMNSPGHRANILRASFTQIGVGVAKNSSGRLYWTQQFIG